MASTKIDIIANNKASAALGRVDRQIKGLNRSTAGINTGFNRMRNLILGVGAALGGIRIAKGFLDAAVEVENLGVQLKFITGSATEGAKALDIVTEAAANSSFQLRDMAQASPLLLTVADSTDELNTLLGITGDIAAASGLTFVESAGQLQRAMSGGIAAADLFRERGIKSLLGFQEGVRFTAEETKNQIMSAFENGTTTIAGASADMAQTFTGQISMISDKVFKFQKQVMDAEPFNFLKSIVRLVNIDIEANFGTVTNAASKLGFAVVDTAKNVMIGAAKIIDVLVPVFNTIKSGINGLLDLTDALPTSIKMLGIIGFLMLGIKGKLIVLTIGLVVDKVKEIFRGIVSTITATARKIAGGAKALGLDGISKQLTDFADNTDAKIDKVGDSLKEFVTTIDDGIVGTMPRITEFFGLPPTEEFGPYETKLKDFLDRIQKDLDEQRLLAQEAARAGNIPFADGSTIQPGTPGTDPITAIEKTEQAKAKAMASALASRITQLQDTLKTEREAELDQHNQRLSDIREFFKGSLHEQRRGQELERKEQLRHEKAMAAIKKSQTTAQVDIFKSGQFAQLDLSEMTNDQLVDFTKQAGMDVLNSMAQQNKKAFQLQKALNISMAIMNTARGVTSALATVPFPFNLAIAGLIGAAGAVQIGAIASQQYSGRRFGGPVSNDESYIVGENGPELFTPGATGRITANEGMISGGQTINFNITATDAKSVDELIVQRKPMIVNMIRQATQERGNRPNF